MVLTREAGKNEPLRRRLEALGVECLEMPLVAHGGGADRAALPAALLRRWAWVVLTSPEAAATFLEARPPPRGLLLRDSRRHARPGARRGALLCAWRRWAAARRRS